MTQNSPTWRQRRPIAPEKQGNKLPKTTKMDVSVRNRGKQKLLKNVQAWPKMVKNDPMISKNGEKCFSNRPPIPGRRRIFVAVKGGYSCGAPPRVLTHLFWFVDK